MKRSLRRIARWAFVGHLMTHLKTLLWAASFDPMRESIQFAHARSRISNHLQPTTAINEVLKGKGDD